MLGNVFVVFDIWLVGQYMLMHYSKSLFDTSFTVETSECFGFTGGGMNFFLLCTENTEENTRYRIKAPQFIH